MVRTLFAPGATGLLPRPEMLRVLRPGQLWPGPQDLVPMRSRILRGLAQVLAAKLSVDAPPIALAHDGAWIAGSLVGGRLVAPVRYRAVVETVVTVSAWPSSTPDREAAEHGAALVSLLQEASFRLAHRADHVLGRTLAQLAGWALGDRRPEPDDSLLLPLSQGDLAALAGSSRRLVSQQLKRLEALGRLSTGHGRLRMQGTGEWERLRLLPIDRFVPAWEAWLDAPAPSRPDR